MNPKEPGRTYDNRCDMCGTVRKGWAKPRKKSKREKDSAAHKGGLGEEQQLGSTAKCAALAYEQLRLFRNGNLILEAADTLIKCRECLVWTYIWAFFEMDPGVRNLFEYRDLAAEHSAEHVDALRAGAL